MCIDNHSPQPLIERLGIGISFDSYYFISHFSHRPGVFIGTYIHVYWGLKLELAPTFNPGIGLG